MSKTRHSKYEPTQTFKGTEKEPNTAKHPASGWLKFLWPALAVIVFVIGTVFALNQSPRPDPWQPVKPLSADWFSHPIETNAFKRLPSISGDIYDVFALPKGDHVWAVGSGGLILHSSNGGRNWEQQSPKPAATPKPTASAILISNAYAGAPPRKNQQQYSNQAAQKLDLINPTGEQELLNKKRKLRKLYLDKKKISARNPPTKKQIQIKIPPVVAKQKTTGARPLPPARINPFTSDLKRVYFIDRQRGWVVGANGTVLATADGGKTWQQLISGVKTWFFFIQMQADGQHGWVVGSGGTILATPDGGKTWQQQRSGTLETLASIQIQADGQRGWIIGDNGTILATPDGGKTWQKQASGTKTDLLSIHMQADGRYGWVVGDNGTILATADSGQTWQKQTSDTEELLASIQVQADGQHGWVVGENGAIFATADGGKTWQKQASGTEEALTAIQVQADGQHGWVVGENGTILATPDGGNSWHKQTSGESARQHALAPYRIGFAPWYYLVGGLCLILLTAALTRLLRDAVTADEKAPAKKSISQISVSDKPAGPDSSDYFGALKIARGLARFISNRNTVPPVTLAITGDWGSGKSSVMNFLHAQLKRDGLRPVWFNAWHHREEQQVLASILENVRKQAIPRNPYGLYLRTGLLLKRHWIFKLAALILLASMVYIAGDSERRNATWHYALYTIGYEQPVAMTHESILVFCDTVHKKASKSCVEKLKRIQWMPFPGSATPEEATGIFSSDEELLNDIEKTLQQPLTPAQRHAALVNAVHPSPDLPFMSSRMAAWIGSILTLIIFLIVKGASIMGVGTAGLMQKLMRMGGFEQNSEPVGTRQLFEKQFRQITELFGKRRLVLFIDDLDRCETDYTMKVLETTNFLASSGELFIVIGMAPRYVLANVNLHFSQLAGAVHEVEKDNGSNDGNIATVSQNKTSFARRYLQKLINIEVPVPRVSDEQIREMLLDSGGEMDLEGIREAAWNRQLRLIKKVFWFVLVIATVGMAAYHGNHPRIERPAVTSPSVASPGQPPSSATIIATSNPASASRENSRGANTSASFTPGEPVTRSWWTLTAFPLLFIMVLLTVGGLYLFLRKTGNNALWLKRLGIIWASPQQTEDSKSFSDALSLWNPVIFNANPNPRKIKVFLNHLRYMSSRISNEGSTNEAHLVAIAALHYALGKEIMHLHHLSGKHATSISFSDNPNAISTAWQQHETTFKGLPAESDWNNYLQFINDVEIHQPKHQRQSASNIATEAFIT